VTFAPPAGARLWHIQAAMNFDVAIDNRAHYMRVTVTGRPEIDELLSMIHLLGVESETWPEHRVLVDLRGVATPFSRLDQFRIGEEAAASLCHMDKIASVVPPERITRVSERAAQRNGTNVRVFEQEGEAEAWLSAD
jgi:hypothetical protein